MAREVRRTLLHDAGAKKEKEKQKTRKDAKFEAELADFESQNRTTARDGVVMGKPLIYSHRR